MKQSETIKERVERKLESKQRVIAAARGDEPCDLVLKNAMYLNVFTNEFDYGDIGVCQGLIVGMGRYKGTEEVDLSGKMICPGFIDAHIHLESSLVSPREFARAVVSHGTTTVVTDPHEIANVMGVDGIKYMMEATEDLPIDVHFMLPSCVPSTPMDESGADLDYLAIDELYDHPRVLGLAEMMNFEGVINGDEACVSKILGAQGHHKKIDGHAPVLTGKRLNAYIAGGVYSDHECYTSEGAMEKLRKGQFIMIREGTAAHNLQALLPLLTWQYYSRCMFCTDDKHPSDLLTKGHIDYIVKKAIAGGVDPVIAMKTAGHNAARYFLLNNKGAIAPGYLADMVVFDNPESFNIERVYKKGEMVFGADDASDKTSASEGQFHKIPEDLRAKALDTFHVKDISPEAFDLGESWVIGMVQGELITENCGKARGVDTERDILKVAVVERHHATGHIGLAYLKGYGLKKGAVATSISHDSHNIIAVGANDQDLALAVSAIVGQKGGIAVVEAGRVLGQVGLEIAGLMSESPLEKVNEELEKAKEKAFELGVHAGIDPFMTLSFISLPVIQSLRVTTTGVFDVNDWKYI